MADRYDKKGRKLQTGEMYDEKTGRYVYKYKDTDGVWRRLYSWTLTRNDRIPVGKNQRKGESLREKEDEVKKKLVENINNSKGNMTLYDLMELYTRMREKDVKASTQSGYRTQLNFMRENPFGKKKIGNITLTDAQKWFDDLHEKYGKNYSTLQTLRGILRPAYTMAKKNQWVSMNPFDFPMLKKRYGGQRTRDALSRKDMRRFLDFVRTDRHFSKYFEGVYILFNTGLRISEFCGLSINEGDIDFDKHSIHVRRQLLRAGINGKTTYYLEDSAKTDAGVRDVPMTDDVEECFRRAIQKRKTPERDMAVSTLDGSMTVSGFLWLDKNGNPEVAQHWENHFRWAVAKFNKIFKDELEDVTPHVARHTFCSNMASAGMAPKTLQYIMGHSSIEVTMNVYTHLEADDVTAGFRDMMNSKQYTMYSLDIQPEIYAPADVDMDDEEPETPEND